MTIIQDRLQKKFEKTVERTIANLVVHIDRQISYYIDDSNPVFGARIMINVVKYLKQFDEILEEGLFAVNYLFKVDAERLTTDDRLIYLALMNNLREHYKDFSIDDYFDKNEKSTIMAMTPKFQSKLTGAMFLAEGKKTWNDMVDYYITSITAELERMKGSKLEGNRILFTTDAHGNGLSFCTGEAEKMFEEISNHFKKLGFEIWIEGEADIKQVFPLVKYDWEVKVIQS